MPNSHSVVKVTGVKKYTNKQLWELPMADNDINATTIGEYLSSLLLEVWIQAEGFSGKRPFGNSGWKHELYKALLLSEAIKGEYESYDDGNSDFIDIVDYDTKAANKLIENLIKDLTANG